MRVLSQKDLKTLKSKNIKVIDKKGRRIRPKIDETEKTLAKVSLSTESILSQLGGIKNVLIKMSQFIVTTKKQSIDGEIQTKKKKSWRFKVIRNNEGFITEIIAKEI